MIDGIVYIDNFLTNADWLLNNLNISIDWDERMTIRKTASYGVAYNYSQISYPYQPLPPVLARICFDIQSVIGFEPNNCLINYYPDGRSKMGFHSDQTDILDKDTGVAIISLGVTRTLRFRQIQDKNAITDIALSHGSLLYMVQEVQQHWQHAILQADTDKARMSLTLRRIA